MIPETLLTVKEYADLIRVHPRTVYRRIWQHRQPGALRVGRDIRIDLSEALQARSGPESDAPGLMSVFTRV